MDESLQEFCGWHGAATQLDRPAAVIRGVKILGLQSRNGRTYRPAALAAAVPLYEDVRVNVNHPQGDPAAPRDYRDRLGTLRNVALRPGEGLFADFHYNPKHALAEQLLWDAEHAPHNAGFSHNVQARVSRRDGATVVEAITRVTSVDLVADPATTRGLFEQHVDDAASVVSAAPSLAVATLDDLKRLRGDLVAEVLGEQRLDAGSGGHVDDAASVVRTAARRQQAFAVLTEFGLATPDSGDPLGHVLASPAFVEALVAAADETAMRALVAERARLVIALVGRRGALPHARPVARDQRPPASPLDAKAFVEAIT